MDLLERVPPQNLEAESSVLGSMLLDTNAAWEVAQFLKTEHFYSKGNRLVYQAIMELTRNRQPADILLLRDELTRRGELETVGGVIRLQELLEVVPTAANAVFYARIVVERAQLRDLIHVATEVIKDAYESPQPAAEVVDAAEHKFFEVTQRRVSDTSASIADLMHEELDKIDRLAAGEQAVGLPTHLVDIDGKINGLKPGELTIVAARPSMGKTSLATTVIRNCAVLENTPIVFYSMEMARNQVARNMLCSHARVDSFKLQRGELDQQEMNLLRDGACVLGEAPIFIDDASALTIMELRARARMMKLNHDVGLVVVDYLQLMDGDSSRRGDNNRQQEISKISRGLKTLARELNVPVMALSQLSRGPEARDGHRPRLSDLRESGSIEQDADVVWLLFREAYYKPDNPEIANDAQVIIAKNRNGPVGTIKLFFHKEYTRFDNVYAG